MGGVFTKGGTGDMCPVEVKREEKEEREMVGERRDFLFESTGVVEADESSVRGEGDGDDRGVVDGVESGETDGVDNGDVAIGGSFLGGVVVSVAIEEADRVGMGGLAAIVGIVGVGIVEDEVDGEDMEVAVNVDEEEPEVEGEVTGEA